MALDDGLDGAGSAGRECSIGGGIAATDIPDIAGIVSPAAPAAAGDDDPSIESIANGLRTASGSCGSPGDSGVNTPPGPARWIGAAAPAPGAGGCGPGGAVAFDIAKAMK